MFELILTHSSEFTEEPENRNTNSIYFGTRQELINTLNKSNKRKCGYVYIIESDHAIKIGKTFDPQARINYIISSAENYGRKIKRVALSELHYKFSYTESTMHHKFSDYRIGGEWFSASFDDALSYLMAIEKLPTSKGDNGDKKHASDFIWSMIQKLTPPILDADNRSEFAMQSELVAFACADYAKRINEATAFLLDQYETDSPGKEKMMQAIKILLNDPEEYSKKLIEYARKNTAKECVNI